MTFFDHMDIELTKKSDGESADPQQLLQKTAEARDLLAVLSINHPNLAPEVIGALASVRSLLNEWALFANESAENLATEGANIDRLRAVVFSQTHRLQMANEMLADMTHLAKKDHLTGAWNTLALSEAGPGLFERMNQSSKPLSCIFLDLDFFKKVNDVHGHAAGDHVLEELAKIICEHSRLSDFLFRLGDKAEEFCLLLPETDAAGAVILAERIRNYLEKNPIEYEGVGIVVTASIGVAQADFEKQTGFDDVKKQADFAQREAKLTRNTVVCYHPSNGSPESYVICSAQDRYRYPPTNRYEPRGEANEGVTA